MLVQSKKVDFELVEEEAKNPVYGGYHRLDPNTLNDVEKKYQFVELDKYMHKRAKTHLRSANGVSPRALIEIGDLHFKNNKFPRATQAYIDALKIDNDNLSLYQKLILSHLGASQFDQADRFHKILLDKTERHVDYLVAYLSFRITISLADDKFVNETISLMTLEKNNKSDQVQNVRGLFELLVKGKPKEAIDIFKAALKLNGNSVDLNNNIGTAYQMLGNFSSATKYYQKAHFIDLKYLAAYENLASTYFIQGKIPKSIEILDNAITNGVELSSIWQHNHAMFYFMINNFNVAIDKYVELLKIEPENSLILNNIGLCHEKLGNNIKAKVSFKKAVEIVKTKYKNGGNFDLRASIAFNNLTRMYLETMNDEAALQTIKHTTRIFPLNNVAYHQKAIILTDQKKYSEAKDLLRKSISLEPRYLDSYINLSYILEDIEFDYFAAIELLELLDNRLNYDNFKIVTNNLAYAYLKTGQLEKAKQYLEDEDNNFAALATRGLYFLLIDDFPKAKKMYEQAISNATGTALKKTKQFYHYELMEYWFNKGDIQKALSHAKESLKYPVNNKVIEVIEKFISVHKSNK